MISEVTRSRFNQLYEEYNQTLLCPCSKATIPLRDFVNSTVTLHSLCSSVFISKQWIEALYSPIANRYQLNDFRKTASYVKEYSQQAIIFDLI
ncbi:unnamed protein product [Adineta ricciae]|uniref:Uncharacterized protein n=1 Tax=Adineta ricciae TaxID=249248 RepID=A0A815TZY3_ADIRI|nr:unnamed protein product [Adineta ricciae]